MVLRSWHSFRPGDQPGRSTQFGAGASTSARKRGNTPADARTNRAAIFAVRAPPPPRKPRPRGALLRTSRLGSTSRPPARPPHDLANAATNPPAKRAREANSVARPHTTPHWVLGPTENSRMKTPNRAAVLAAPLGPLAAHSLTRVLPLAPSTVPKSTDRRLRRCSPGPSVLTLAPKFLHQTS